MPAILPGVALALAVTGVAMWLSQLIGTHVLGATGASPISPITVAIVLGILIGNAAGTPKVLAPGLDFCVQKLLRLGIVLIGLKLSLGDIVHLGAYGVPVVAVFIVTALASTMWVGRRLGVTDGLGMLTAAATSICGVTAAVSVAPVIEASDEELSYTVANVTLYGVFAMVFYPYLAHLVFGAQSLGAGLFLGTSIHDTSQVMGAALSYKQIFHDEVAFKVATITKLTRNMCLVGVVPLLAYLHARRKGAERRETRSATLFPRFVLYFLAMVLLRTAGDRYWPSDTWKWLVKLLSDQCSLISLGAALASVGLTTQLARLRKLGLRPLWLGGLAATVVGALGMSLATLVTRLSP